MMLIYSLSVLFGITTIVSGMGRCLQLTWDNKFKSGRANCSDIPASRPCVPPLVTVSEGNFGPPDVYDIWQNRNKTAFSCPLTGNNACIKYSYTSNNAVEHISYFCGKMISNNETEISSECFTSQVSVYTIEACACQTLGDNNTFPCNSSNRLHIATIHLIIIASILIISDNRFFQKIFYA